MNQTIKQYFDAKSKYYSGKPIMSDIEFDKLETSLSVTNPEILKHIGYSERTGKEKLPVLMGSLDQIKTEKDFAIWKTKFPNSKIVITEKIDGNSCLLEYKQGILINSWSRGDGVFGASNIRHTARMSGIPQFTGNNFTGYIRGELVIQKKDWTSLLAVATREYANARNFVAGFMNATVGQAELYKYFHFVAFEHFNNLEESKSDQLNTLKLYGFTIPMRKLCDHQLQYSDIEILIGDMIKDSDYELDGVVADVDEQTYRIFVATPEDLNPSYAIKIKLVNSSVETKVLGIEWAVSKDGFLKPVVLVSPVALSGVTVSRVTGYNAKFIVDNGIGIGAVVAIIRSGDVVPKIVGVTTDVAVKLPEGIWNTTGVDLISTSIDGSYEQRAKIMQYYFSKMEIDFIGEGAIAKLMTHGSTIIDIINKPDILEEVIGENGRKAAVMMQKILTSTTPQRLFAALGCFGRGLGERKLKVVFDRYSVSEVLDGNISVMDYCDLSGYDIKSAELIHSNTSKAKDIYEQIKSPVSFEQPTTQTLGIGKFSNDVLVATGVRLSPEHIAKIQAAGGIVSDAFTKATTILVAKDPKSTSGKAVKAREMGISVISLAELMNLL